MPALTHPFALTFALQRSVLYLAVAGAVAVIAVVWAVTVLILRRRHDRALEDEVRRELDPPKPQEMSADVRVVPQEELPPERPTVFMPVPGTLSNMVSFVEEARDGVSVRSCVRAEDADALLSDEKANNLCAVVFRDGAPEQEIRAFIYTDVLSDSFSPYSYVDLSILRKQGLIGETVSAVTVEARGVLRKPLMVAADDFSLTAVKMLSLTGGRAVKLRYGSSR